MAKKQIIDSQTVFCFDRNIQMRKKVFEYESALEKYFNIPFQIINVPDEELPDIPRFESRSKKGHSKIQVSQSRIALTTQYSNHFKDDPLEIKKYQMDRIGALKPLIESEKTQFSGFVLSVDFPMENGLINGYFKEHAGIAAINDGTIDCSFNYSHSFQDKFFTNVRCTKYSRKEIKIDPKQNEVTTVDTQEFGIKVIIDINSRLSFNKTRECNQDLFGKVIDNVFKLVEERSLTDFLNGNIL